MQDQLHVGRPEDVGAECGEERDFLAQRHRWFVSAAEVEGALHRRGPSSDSLCDMPYVT